MTIAGKLRAEWKGLHGMSDLDVTTRHFLVANFSCPLVLRSRCNKSIWWEVLFLPIGMMKAIWNRYTVIRYTSAKIEVDDVVRLALGVWPVASEPNLLPIAAFPAIRCTRVS